MNNSIDDFNRTIDISKEMITKLKCRPVEKRKKIGKHQKKKKKKKKKSMRDICDMVKSSINL